VQANGGSVIFEPIDHPYGRLSTVVDDHSGSPVHFQVIN
jgi:hypothetical protein